MTTTTLAPDTEVPDDRRRLVSISHYAHRPDSGWSLAWNGVWQHADGTTVDIDPEGWLLIRRHPQFPRQNVDLPFTSTAQAIDLLAAYGLLPVQFSTGYLTARARQWRTDAIRRARGEDA